MRTINIPKVAWIMALLGILSGIICTFPPEIVTKFEFFDTPVFHGIVFGAVIAFGQYRWGNGSMTGIVIILCFTTIGWIAAVNGFTSISDDAKTYLYPAAMFAGGIGAVGTLIGAALANSTFRNPKLWLLTIVVGALTGILVILDMDSSNAGFLALFVVWQSAIAFCFGLAMNNGPLKSPRL